jgi:hypothetical protein
LKNIEVDYPFVRERVVRRMLEVDFISSKDQVAGRCTKALFVTLLEQFKHSLNLYKVKIEGAC